MSVAGARGTVVIDRSALDDALAMAAARCGRLSNEDLRTLRRKRRGTIVTAATVSAAVLLTIARVDRFAATPAASPHWTRVLATRAGQRGMATLADGSTISLNGATRVLIDYTAGRRSVRLTAGQAFFDVRHDRARPFVVRAGAAEARVLGTAFDIDITRRQIALAVYRGAVGFDTAGSPRGVVVRAGYRSSMRDGAVETPGRFDPMLPDWRQGWIDTEGMRLDDLVEVLGRQGAVRIVAPTGTLASIRIAGRFRTDRPRELLGAIGNGFGFAVAEGPDGIRLKPAS